jgi:cholecystokinin A receptor
MDLKLSLVAALTTSLYDDNTTSQVLLSCEDFTDNVTAQINFINDGAYDKKLVTEPGSRYLQAAEYVVNRIAAPTICSFGIVGNLLNLLVLTRKRLQCSMDRMEKSAHVGLVSLAVSDLMFCLFYLLTLVVPTKTVSRSINNANR